nr:hypothetical protein [Leptolyngbya sp. 7M]
MLKKLKVENESAGAIALEQWFQNRDRYESEASHALKQLERCSNQLDCEPSTLGNANRSKSAQPLAKNHLRVQCNPEF